jgi:anaerobic magnesium-protoporphyrin IX monomethyl ester cyclase
MPHIHLVCMPHYSFDTNQLQLPLLSIACLASYCKRAGIDVVATDFNIIGQFPLLRSSRQHHCYHGRSFVAELPDLALVLGLIKNSHHGKPLLEDFDEILLSYVQDSSLNLFRLKEGLQNALGTIDKHVDAVAQSDIVGFTCVPSNFLFTVMLALLLRRKKPGIRIVCGGPLVSYSQHTARLLLKLCVADVVVIGEGEDPLVKLIMAYDQNRSPAVDGTMTYDAAVDEFNTRAPAQPLDLNTLPDPDFSVFSLGKYSLLRLPLYGSRGCVYKCNYCTFGASNSFRIRDPVAVVASMQNLNKKHNTFRFYFNDAILNADPAWLERFAYEIIRRNLRFQWWGFFKPWMSHLLLSHLKRAGLYGLTLEAESFSNTMLQKMGKEDVTCEKIFQTIELLCRQAIFVSVGIVAGFPGENGNDFYYSWRQVVRLQKKFPQYLSINPQIFQVQVASGCYTNPNQYGISMENWYQDTEPPLPEVVEMVKKIPKYCSVKKPSTTTAWERLLLYQNIKKPADLFLSDGDKELLIKTLEFVEPSWTVRIEVPEYLLHTVQSPAKNRIDILEIGSVKILLSEKERYTFHFLNGFTTLADIAAKLAQEYKEDPAEAFQSIIHFLYYLLDFDVPFEVKY